MTLDELKKIVKNESDRVEFKSTTGEIHKACRTVCAFLNNHGGIVFIGVKDDGRPVGQMVTDATRKEIANELRKFEPPSMIEVSYIPVDRQKTVIALEVPPGNHIPYTFDGRPYHRFESSTSLMPQHLYEQLLIKRGQLNHDWDEFISDQYTVDDLDHDEIRNTIKWGVRAKRISETALKESVVEVLSRLKLLKNGKLKNAAVVLYAKEMQSPYSQCMIKMARFNGISKSDDFIDNQQVHGHAFKILTEASEFMRKHLNIASFFDENSFVRVDKFTVPVLAVREAMINAVCHRMYQSNAAISLSIFDDRLEIWNNGFLPVELNVEDLKKKHESYPRNKLIARTLYKIGLIEKWGMGTVKMIEMCQEHGLLDPIFEEYSSGLSVQFIFEEPIGPRANVMKSKPQLNLMVQKSSLLDGLSRRQREIVEILEKSGELKASDIMQKLMEPPSDRTLRDDLLALKKLDLIDFRGRARATFWFIKQ